jgi:hypothetical protein
MSFKWKDGITPNLLVVDAKVRSGIVAAQHAMAPRAESYLKSTAPWTDRTGAARNGLTARPESGGKEYKIILAHGVDYGIWLEVAHSGAYAVIIPAIPVLGPQYFRLASQLAGARLRGK